MREVDDRREQRELHRAPRDREREQPDCGCRRERVGRARPRARVELLIVLPELAEAGRGVEPVLVVMCLQVRSRTLIEAIERRECELVAGRDRGAARQLARNARNTSASGRARAGRARALSR